MRHAAGGATDVKLPADATISTASVPMAFPRDRHGLILTPDGAAEPPRPDGAALRAMAGAWRWRPPSARTTPSSSCPG